MLALSQLVVILCATGFTIATPTIRQKCDKSALNTTIGIYIAQKFDTIFTIAAATDRGVCDIARANLMADATLFNVGQQFAIPAQVCRPDNSTCLLVAGKPTRDCVFGGPHTYLTVPKDTIASIALEKFNITVESLFNESSRMLPNGTTPYTLIEPGNNLKLPLCSPSQCIVQPYRFTYGTYKDIAEQLGTTVGQLFAINPGYNHSIGGEGPGPVLAVPMHCKALTSNYTAIS